MDVTAGGRTGLRLFLCGDVMTGRGIDQILPYSCEPRLYESVITSARDYVHLAERMNGPIPMPADYEYVWGDALDVLRRLRPHARIVNLETSVTTSGDAVPKGINYRMHPGNVRLLTAAGVDCCVLANNHVLDWGVAGLLETLAALTAAGITVAGAGRDLSAATAPAALVVPDEARVLVYGFAATDSGVPSGWAARAARPGVHLIRDFGEKTVTEIGRLIALRKRAGDIAVASVHWGSNWGYDIPRAHRQFAHALIDRAGVDVIHGHSSHHPKAIEVYRGHLILYGCGDFVSDYEGITGYEEFRDDLVLMYFTDIDPRTGVLARLRIMPLRLRNFRLNQTSETDLELIHSRMDSECRRFGHRVVMRRRMLELDWAADRSD